MWLRTYGEAIEADLLFRGVDLLDFYRGRITARRLAALIKALPPDSYTGSLARGEADNSSSSTPAPHAGAAPRCLEDIPVARSLHDAIRFVNSSDEEFAAMTDAQRRAG